HIAHYHIGANVMVLFSAGPRLPGGFGSRAASAPPWPPGADEIGVLDAAPPPVRRIPTTADPRPHRAVSAALPPLVAGGVVGAVALTDVAVQAAPLPALRGRTLRGRGGLGGQGCGQGNPGQGKEPAGEPGQKRATTLVAEVAGEIPADP